MIGRMLGAARLDSHTYEDVERDRGATLQALAIVVLVTIAGLVGQLLSGDEIDIVSAVIVGVVGGVASWALWALATMIVGTTILKTEHTEADWGQLARCTGFAQTPRLLSVLAFIPVVGGLFLLAAFIWGIATMVVAVRQALDYTSTWRAFFVIVIAFIPVAIVNAIIWVVIGGVAETS